MSQLSRGGHGFSLIEVVLALGILSFALVGLFGALPFGLGVFRQAIDQTVSAQIAQEVTGMIQRTPFANLSDLGIRRADDNNPGTTASFYYYDVEGTLLGAIPSATGGGGGAAAAKPANPVYRVQVYVADATETASLLGSSGSVPWSGPLSNIKAVHIDVRNVTMRAADEQKLITYVANAGF